MTELVICNNCDKEIDFEELITVSACGTTIRKCPYCKWEYINVIGLGYFERQRK